MFERWRTKRRNREIVERVYDALVERARRPALYIDGELPDTVMGRYEALGVEVLLLLHRCRTDPALGAFAQDLVDRFMLDMDHSLREIGIGYQGIPRRMRKLATRFYTRVGDYRTPLADLDAPALEAALRRRAYGEDGPTGDGPAFVANYMMEAARSYAVLPSADILSGRLGPTPETLHAG